MAPCDHQFIRIRWENLEKQRYYEVVLVKDFFDWVLTRAWGRINSPLGQVVNCPYPNFRAGLAQAKKIERQRRYRGYQLIILRGEIDAWTSF